MRKRNDFIRMSLLFLAVMAILSLVCQGRKNSRHKGWHRLDNGRQDDPQWDRPYQGREDPGRGDDVRIPADAVVVDAAGKYVMPGIIDAMTYFGVRPFDLNDSSNP